MGRFTFKENFGGEVESSYRKDDDFISAAEWMEQVFDENKEKEWGAAALERLTNSLDEASKELVEYYSLRLQIQKAYQNRASVDKELRKPFVMFRQSVLGA